MKCLICSALMLALSSVSNADVITLQTDAWCPYSCDPSSDKKGILVEVAEIIFQKAGHNVEYSAFNWARAINNVRLGKADGLVDAYKSDAPDFIFSDEPIVISKMCFFTKRDDPWKFEGYNSLKERTISIINQYSYGEVFDAYIQKNKSNASKTISIISGLNLTQRRIRLIYRSRVDTILEDWKVFPHQIKEYYSLQEYKAIKGFKNVGCLPGEGLYIAFSPIKKTSQDYANLISAGLRELKKSGELDKIISKY